MMNIVLFAQNSLPASLRYNDHHCAGGMWAEGVQFDIKEEENYIVKRYHITVIKLDRAPADNDTIERVRGCFEGIDRLSWEQQVMLAEIVEHQCNAEAVNGMVSLFKFSFKLAFALYEMQSGQWTRFSSMEDALDHGSIEDGFESKSGGVLVRRYP